jgi:hypothetical protein
MMSTGRAGPGIGRDRSEQGGNSVLHRGGPERRGKAREKYIKLVSPSNANAIMSAAIQNGEDALHISQQLDGITDPELYFLKIKELTSAGQMVDNIDSVMKLVGFAMKGPSSDQAQASGLYINNQILILKII